MLMSPARFRVSFVGLAVCSVLFRAIDDAPARDKGVDSLDAGDPVLQLGDSASYAFDPLDVVLAVSSVVCVGLV